MGAHCDLQKAMVSLVRMVALLLASMLAAPASAKKCDLPCAKAGTLDLGTVCKAVDYTLTIKTSETILPVVQDFTKTLKERINSSATVTCGGWAAPGSTIVCTVKDASGATNSSTNQIENMRRLAVSISTSTSAHSSLIGVLGFAAET